MANPLTDPKVVEEHDIAAQMQMPVAVEVLYGNIRGLNDPKKQALIRESLTENPTIQVV